MGLGLRDVVFRGDRDAKHIHQTLLGTFPILAVWKLFTSSPWGEFIHNDGNYGPLSVSYLKDILNHAELYVRSLHKDITEDDMKHYVGLKEEVFLCLRY